MPLHELAVPYRVVGTKAVRKALSRGSLKKVFIAKDAEPSIVDGLWEQAASLGVEVEWADSKVVLGRACAIDRPASAAGI
ncbi:ribosomal L7Ae/L30e/S12e/Gadd45 family protein [Thermovirga sp.]|uniref:ribosomal L7Ae/L30e/S12e/Gadd45 family protein n=1 Tax=Thermovirga sp. TaxID=2699834 RepID=UPI0025DC888C|nr:ribosomal L7Ae/L30e/S12e/Gadd45 family protein [Thermovirga sp.]MBO8154181.1 ribosomal L7Ae/L30e/S12e/Gadd45 family protein [Thermovirga sp.]